jgi:uncharacterized protein (DUF433 family)
MGTHGDIEAAPEILGRQMYGVAEAARLLRIESAKLRRWLNGAVIQGREYPPVIRVERSGSDVLTWAEFIEAGFLREYRDRSVPLQRLRPFIDALRVETEVEHPLAYFQPAVDESKRELVLKAQQDVALEDQLVLVRRAGPGWQLQWAEPVLRFLDKVEFNPLGVAERMHPLGKARPVRLDPEVQFGIPQIRGLRTEAIAEAFAEVGDASRVAKEWNLDESEVQAALQWELVTAAAA